MLIEIGVFVVALSTFVFYLMYRQSRRLPPPAWLGGDLFAPNLIAVLMGGFVIGVALIGRHFLEGGLSSLRAENWALIGAIVIVWVVAMWLVGRASKRSPTDSRKLVKLAHTGSIQSGGRGAPRRKRAA
jgi:hypothetical protein